MAAERGWPGAFPLPAHFVSRWIRTILAAGGLLCAAALPARGQALQERLAPCLACHGETGRSENPEVPSLGGQPSAFLVIQLYVFRERQRIAEPMNQLTKGLTDDDLRSFSDELAKLPAPVAAGPADPARMEKGRALSARHRCGFCHNPDFSGHDQIPRIAVQREDYLVKALREYRSQERRGYDPSMVDIARQLGDAEILDLAYYLANWR
jgi:cytochrome c553